MAEDLPALQNIKRGQPYPIDRTLHDGDEVKLGGVTLVAHLTPGHTRGCTTWTMKVQEGGRSYDVVLGKGGPNPYIDLTGYKTEINIQETAFNMEWDSRKKSAPQR